MTTFRVIESDHGREDILTEEDMEWVLNALRLMQEHQQELAGDHAESELSGPSEVTINIGDMFLEQHGDVTGLRERLVTLAGRDLTDG